MAKLTLEKRRLETLRRQLYGREDKLPKKNSEIKVDLKQKDYELSKQPIRIEAVSSETSSTYLRNDLTKILILSSIAIATQILIFFLSKNNLVNLKFF